MATVFHFQDYKTFIKEMIAGHASVRGYQGRMAEAVGCPKSYFSQVLHSKSQLSQEQAMRLCLFWSFNENETEFFLELVNLSRTSFPPLMRRIRKRLESIRAQAEDLADRFAKTRFLDAEKEAHYYSAWYWSAVHILVGIRGYQTAEAIADHLGMPVPTVSEILDRLAAMGLVKSDGKKWEMVPGHLHLRKESPMLPIHHANWRHEAVADSRRSSTDAVHYTVVASHSVADFDKLKQLLLGSLDSVRAIIDPSPNQEMTCLCLDFFRVGRV